MKRTPKKHDKPGPKEERLIITDDPQEVLKRLLRPKEGPTKLKGSERSG